MTNFYVASFDDKRVAYASDFLQEFGYKAVDNLSKADFVLTGVNPPSLDAYRDFHICAGNVSCDNVFDYTKNERFAAENAFYTAEAAVCIACQNSDLSLVNSNVLILGYGRIAKALHRFLTPYTSHITVCARNGVQRTTAEMNGALAVTLDELTQQNDFDFVFNTVPHPIINERELRSFKKDVLLVDLASFPGGIDVHFAESLGLNLIVARGLPAKYSPKSAGKTVAKAVIEHMGVKL